MKIFLTAFLLIGLLSMGWGCRNAAVKSGSEQVAEQPVQETSVSDDPETQAEAEEEIIEVREPEKLVLNIDEEKEADSIYSVIETLEDCYRTTNYNRWLSLLTQSYKNHFDDPDNLASEGWDATNIREFFDLLVRTRRKGNIRDLEISRVEFVSDYKAFIYVILGGEEFPEPQHTFIRIGESWYKGLSTEEV